jgi:hypothetical protein
MAATYTYETIEKVIEAVFCVRSSLSLYNKGQLTIEVSKI